MSVPHGRQQERTRLAWRRTVAAVVVLSLVLTRAAVVDGTGAAAAAGVAAVAVAVLVWASFLRRGGWTEPSPRDPDLLVLRDGRVHAAVAGVVLTLAALVVLLAWS